jgi:methylglyoxal synthase
MDLPLSVALVAHDHCEDDLLAWATVNRDTLAGFQLVATGTTGQLLSDALDLPVERMRSGTLGGDVQIPAAIVEGRRSARAPAASPHQRATPAPAPAPP